MQEKSNFWKSLLSNLGCDGDVNVDVHGFEVIQLFSEGVRVGLERLLLYLPTVDNLPWLNLSIQDKASLTCFSAQQTEYRKESLLQAYTESTLNFANVTARTGTSYVIPSPCMTGGVHFSTIFPGRSSIRLAFVPVSVVSLCSINPEPSRGVSGIPVQANKHCLWYFGGKCLLFRLWLHHSKGWTHCFAGFLCCFPAQSAIGDFIAWTLEMDPAIWTNTCSISIV